jgi:hypothetical protein
MAGTDGTEEAEHGTTRRIKTIKQCV